MKRVNNCRTARLKPLLGLMIVLSGTLPAQRYDNPSEKYATVEAGQPSGQFVSLLFWNVENLFDYHDDSLTNDEDFTVSGSNHWTFSKLQTKINKLAKTILAAGLWDPPAIIGLCEIENRYVLNKLVYSSPLAPFRYRVIHRDSPDKRGIDVALIYRDSLFAPLYSRWITVRFPFDTTVRTRDILYVKGLLCQTDTLHLVVNHWPSRLGGEKQSAPRRDYVASLLRHFCDSLLGIAHVKFRMHTTCQMPIQYPESHIPYLIIMGDFNDEPDNESLTRVLGATHPDSVCDTTRLVNLMYPKLHKEGTHKFREHWGLLDQFIVSVSLLTNRQESSKNVKKGDNGESNESDIRRGEGRGFKVGPRLATIFRQGFLMQEDIRYLDVKPSRTYLGPRYLGGFSDHLPVILQLEIR